MKLSLKNRFVIPTVVLVVVGMGLSVLVSNIVAGNGLEENVRAQLKQALDLTDQRITTFLKDRKADVFSWSQTSIVRDALDTGKSGTEAAAEASSYVSQVCKQSGYYDYISVGDPSGNIVASSFDGTVGKVNIKDRDYFKEAMKGNLTVSEVLMSRTTGNPGFFIAAPVRGQNGIRGIVYGSVNVNTFSATFIDPVKVGLAGQAFLFQRDGTLIAYPDKSLVMKINAKDLDFAREMQQRGQGFIRYPLEGDRRIAAFGTNKELNWLLVVGASEGELFEPIRRLDYYIIGAGLLLSLLSAVVILIVAHTALKPIKRIAASLGETARDVSSASEQVASAGKQLAGGASEQAAAIEETSTSLEEMASMIRQNDSSADECRSAIQEAEGIVSTVHGHMKGLTESIERIKGSSEETVKIIKSIDEIAFQTNLLALNAAVEAARAGEAGAGFAVVADEVRNLALRAAEAARNTGSMIENTVNSVREGSSLAALTSEAFEKNMQITRKVGDLVSGIAAASREQAQGIGQINKAVSDIDTVTQGNASAAEESAAASELMKTRAAVMRDSVFGLLHIIDGREMTADESPDEADRERTLLPGPVSG